MCALRIELQQIKTATEQSSATSSSSTPLSYSDVLKTPAMKTELHMEVRSVIKDADRRSRNVVITGLKSIVGQNASAFAY